MIALLERLLPLWTEPVGGRGDPEAAFGEVYADPVAVNGEALDPAWIESAQQLWLSAGSLPALCDEPMADVRRGAGRQWHNHLHRARQAL